MFILGTISKKCILKTIFFLGYFLISPILFATSLPYNDVQPGNPYYKAILELYRNGIITDSPDHTFHPNDVMKRDLFTMLALGASCKSCITPTIDEIVKYRENPFPDVTRSNALYNCIAYAKDHGIAQGYTLDPSTNKTQCQDKNLYSTTPFCPNDTISRIEAIAMLLRQTNLWNDHMNQDTNRNLTISDVNGYWYGYAKKAIEAGIITLDSEAKLYPDAPVTRGEFAIMTVRAMRLNQCNEFNNDLTGNYKKNEIGVSIDYDRNQNGTYSFQALSPESEQGNLSYGWTLINQSTAEIILGTGSKIDSVGLNGTGNWIVSVTINDTRNQKQGSSITNILIGSGPDTNNSGESSNGGMTEGMGSNTGTQNLGNIASSITANPITPDIGEEVTFSTTIRGGKGPYMILWNFGDGDQSSEADIKHAFLKPGHYTVTLSVRDREGTPSVSQIVMLVTGVEDIDGDSVGDGEDRCKEVFGEKENAGCPLLPGQKIENGEKFPTEVHWNDREKGILQDKNVCLAIFTETNPAILTELPCQSCPCPYIFDTSESSLALCDIIFPVILSHDKKSIYSRGNIFQVK